MKTQAYYNLHRHLFSLRKSGKVFLHTDNAVFENVKFHVQKAGQQKVREEKRKNVHAYISGEHVALLPLSERGWEVAYYNPYICDTFEDKETGEPLTEASMVWISCYNNKPIIYYRK